MQNILTVKKFISPITNEFAGYIVDDNGIKKTVLIGSKSYLEIEKWLSEDGNNLSPAFTDEEIEKERQLDINTMAKKIILSKYPLEKQSSAQLGIYGDTYLTEMTAFISNIITISNDAVKDGIALTDIDWGEATSPKLTA